MSDLDEQIRLHSAGATVSHFGAFAYLPTFQNTSALRQEFIDTWVVPFYRRIGEVDDDWTKLLIARKDLITKEVVVTLLGDFNWRTRQTGAFFAAIKGFIDLTDIIGTHFLKSEVCYAGRVYATVFAAFNTEATINYLERYLAYYLGQPELWFDQQQALEALLYLDKTNRTSLASKHISNWTKFIANKPHWNEALTTNALDAQLQLIERVRRG